MAIDSKYLKLASEIREALNNKEPVVALESTIISHGMPYPENAETALKVEQAVRENGACPATIAIIGGAVKIGLSPEEIDHIGKKGPAAAKVSRRDIAAVIAKGGDGATTVAATMIFAAMAGINIFATGGIGGVHRGAEATMDISADLEELANTPVMVVCSGAKSILDIGLTLEYLETKGVPIVGFRTKEFPAFYTRRSGFEAGCSMDTPKEIAGAWRIKQELGIGGGMLVANPIPEEYSMDYGYISEVIGNAVSAAVRQGVKGKDVTPFLLNEIKNVTGGGSLKANIELVLGNARLAARIAAEMCKK